MNMSWKHKYLSVNRKCDDKSCDKCYPKLGFNWWPKLPKIRKIKRKDIK